MFPDGTEDWWVLIGPSPAPELLGGEQRLAIVGGGGLVEEVHTQVSLLSDDATKLVIAPLNSPIGEIEGITRIDWQGGAHPIELNSIHIDHAVSLDYQ